MKSYKLALSIVAACLLLGVSGAAMAVDCLEGRIIFDVVDEIVIDGQPCLVYETVVEGKVQVTNAPFFEISFSEVGGPITIQGQGAEGSDNATVLRTEILKGNLEVTNFGSATIGGNTLDNGNIKVSNNVGAVVQRNTVKGTPPETGNIECTGNTEQRGGGNRVDGVDNCPTTGL